MTNRDKRTEALLRQLADLIENWTAQDIYEAAVEADDVTFRVVTVVKRTDSPYIVDCFLLPGDRSFAIPEDLRTEFASCDWDVFLTEAPVYQDQEHVCASLRATLDEEAEVV